MNKIIKAILIAFIPFSMTTSTVVIANDPPIDPNSPEVSEASAAIKACVGQAEGEGCAFTNRDKETVYGKCLPSDKLQAVRICVPNPNP